MLLGADAAPGALLAEDGPPDVSAVGTEPLGPLLPPPRVSGAVGVRTSTLPPGVPASPRPRDFSPEPMAAGVLPGFDSLRLSHALNPSARTTIETVTHDRRRKRPGGVVETV